MIERERDYHYKRMVDVTGIIMSIEVDDYYFEIMVVLRLYFVDLPEVRCSTERAKGNLPLPLVIMPFQ